ncbi:phenylalanine--tRNA ligase subunit alpha [Ignicoccus hospitalis]|uniref:phenylalanine--tRNA ligase subunit alpha n=1 Tax=Ignicoccus hospitalis TaxID=160233 RepID=UPI001EE24AD7|nr:phenylalanine--tRNA ligase subunit alpha [Ignicoccus hospitalis]
MPEEQYRLLVSLSKDGEDLETVAKKLGKRKEELMRPLAELEKKGLVEVERVEVETFELNEKGKKYLSERLPEEKLLEMGECVELSELKSKLGPEAGVAIGLAKRLGGEIREGKLCYDANVLKEYASRVRRCLEEGSPCEELRKRGFLRKVKVKKIIIKPSELALKALERGELVPSKTVTALTRKDLIEGTWKDAEFKKFDLSVEFPARLPKRRHPLLEFHEYVKEVLVSMGFEEVVGDYVTNAFWNFDVLLVPQFHPARSETDVFYASGARVPPPPEGLLEEVAEVHREMWGYWRAEVALKVLLRTHTTVVSAQTMYSRGGGEYRAFSLDRVFRSETLDPTHSMEFHQLEGIIVGKEVSFKHLLGFFKEFAKKLGLGEVKFKPAYFPFTEPSVEGFVKHPELGWVEVFPGGMFRPEMLKPLGLGDFSVAAWGIGIDRLAMLALGLSDIRDLYSNDLIKLRKVKPIKGLWSGKALF